MLIVLHKDSKHTARQKQTGVIIMILYHTVAARHINALWFKVTKTPVSPELV
jgi:hypothetical protein